MRSKIVRIRPLNNDKSKMMISRVLTFLFFFMIFSFSSNAQLLNGSFESGSNPDLSNWKWTCGAESSNNAPPGGGNWCIKVLSGNIQGWCFKALAYQKLPSVTSGQNYTLSGYVLAERTSGVGLYFGKIKNGIITLLMGDSTSYASWNKISFQSDFILTEGDTAIVALTSGMTGGANIGFGYFDSISLKIGTGISYIEQDRSIRIFPNPFNTFTTVKFVEGNQISNCTIAVYNVFGQEVIKSEIKDSQTKIQRGNLSSGVYFIRIFKDNKISKVNKLIISE